MILRCKLGVSCLKIPSVDGFLVSDFTGSESGIYDLRF